MIFDHALTKRIHGKAPDRNGWMPEALLTMLLLFEAFRESARSSAYPTDVVAGIFSACRVAV